jgi:hypothetical protein
MKINVKEVEELRERNEEKTSYSSAQKTGEGISLNLTCAKTRKERSLRKKRGS